jgi:hypothetical protein
MTYHSRLLRRSLALSSPDLFVFVELARGLVGYANV